MGDSSRTQHQPTPAAAPANSLNSQWSWMGTPQSWKDTGNWTGITQSQPSPKPATGTPAPNPYAMPTRNVYGGDPNTPAGSPPGGGTMMIGVPASPPISFGTGRPGMDTGNPRPQDYGANPSFSNLGSQIGNILLGLL